jgi:hypothetical protein
LFLLIIDILYATSEESINNLSCKACVEISAVFLHRSPTTIGFARCIVRLESLKAEIITTEVALRQDKEAAGTDILEQFSTLFAKSQLLGKVQAMIVRYILRKADDERTQKDLMTFQNILDILQSALEYMEDIWDVREEDLPDEPVEPVKSSFLFDGECSKFDDWLRTIYKEYEEIRGLTIWERIVVFLCEEDFSDEDAIMSDQDDTAPQYLQQEVSLTFRPH